jgi:tryptophanyl-tRNA synthetase
LPEKELKNLINKQIVTDATPLEEPKNPDTAAVFKLYELIASPSQVAEMRQKLEMGGYGWGHAKKDLLDAILERFAEERKKYDYFMQNPGEVEEELQKGALKARETARAVLGRVRSNLGF